MNIDNHSVPGFCSCDKPIIGTLNDFENMAQERANKYEKRDVLQLIDKYKTNHSVKHNVAYHDDQLLRGITLLDIRHIEKEDYSWKHFNIWGYPHDFFAKNVEVERIMCSRYNTIYIASKIKFNGLVLQSSEMKDMIISHTWGYSGIYYFDETVMKTTVYLVEKTFHKMEYYNALKYFNEDINLTEAVNEILGDG